MIPGSSFLGWQGGANTEAAEYAIKMGTPAKANWYQKMFGATDEDAQNIVLRRQQERLNQQYGATMAQLGLTGADWGEDEQDVLSKIANRKEERDIGQRNRLEAKDEKRTADALSANLKINQQQIDAQNDRFAFTSQENTRQRTHEASERSKDRSLERDLGSMSSDMKMQMAFIQQDIENKRMEYDRETRRMDRRDANIAQLMKGLGQLGGLMG
jgi:hypothetical protein